jgi:putative dimethyl sulfoxide reductase chaperone
MQNNTKNLLKGYNLLLYFAGSMIMSEPTEECVKELWTNGTLKKLPVSSLNPRFIKAASLLKESCSETEQCMVRLKDDYFRLFSESGLPLAPAYESIYRNKVNGESLPKVGEFYYSYGWKSRLQEKTPDDHLGIELLFLTRLIDKYLILDDEPCCCEMKKEIHRYIDNHMLSWVPAWNKDIQENSHSICFKGIGTLIYACLEDINSLFS